MTSKSLQDAVLDVAVKNFTFPPKTFSAYDITKILRNEVNAKQYSISDFALIPSLHRQEISHSLVRDTVASLFGSNHFDRTFNGTYYVYTVGTIKNTASDITKDALYSRLTEILSNQTGIHTSDITPNSTLNGTFDFDDLDNVEVVMAMEEEFAKELKNKGLDDSLDTIKDVRALFKYLTDEIASSTKAVPVAVITPVVPVSNVLKMYIDGRHNKMIAPSLKNAQKALNKKSKKTTIREISDIAKNLGYSVVGNQTIPFGEWVIAHKLRR